MNLEALLEYTAKDYLDDRTDLIAGDSDDLWSDRVIVRFLNEAQRILARRAWVIIETGVAPAGVLTLVTGKALYPLHKSVLRVYDATPATQTTPLGRSTDRQLRDPFNAPGADAFDVGVAASLAGNSLTTAGPSLAFATDAGTRVLRIYPPPAAAQNGVQVALKVARLPIKELAIEDMQGEPEVPEEYHLWIADYAVGRCLLLPNVDSQYKTEGRELIAKFEANVKEARQDRQRAEMSASRWGFSSSTAALR